MINRITKIETAGEEKVRLFNEKFEDKIPVVTLYQYGGKNASEYNYILWVNDWLIFMNGCADEILRNIENEEAGIIKSYIKEAYYLIEKRKK